MLTVASQPQHQTVTVAMHQAWNIMICLRQMYVDHCQYDILIFALFMYTINNIVATNADYIELEFTFLNIFSIVNLDYGSEFTFICNGITHFCLKHFH